MDMDPHFDEPVHICTELGEDDPDSFMPNKGQLLEDEVDLSNIPPHLLSIFALESTGLSSSFARVSVSFQCGQIGAGRLTRNCETVLWTSCPTGSWKKKLEGG